MDHPKRFERFRVAIVEQQADIDLLMSQADFCYSKNELTQEEFDILHALAYPVVETPEEPVV